MFKQKPGYLSELNINWRKYAHFLKRIHVENKNRLLEEGDISDKLFIVEKGCIRLGFIKNKKDITMQFFFENDLATSFESFFGGLPSIYFIETLEPSIIHTLDKKDLEHLYENEPTILKMSTAIIMARLAYYADHLNNHLSQSPEERFTNLIENNPSIFMRAPQRHIATYLGITNVSLSRIKARKMQAHTRTNKKGICLD